MGALAHEAHLWSLVLDDEPPVNGVRPPIDEVRFVFRVARDLHRPRQRAQRSGQGQRRSSRANRGRSDSSAPAHQPGSALPDRLTRARRQPTDQPEPRLVDRADARARTGDPFITREVQGRERRVAVSARGHVFAAKRGSLWKSASPTAPAPARGPVPSTYPLLGRRTGIAAEHRRPPPHQAALRKDTRASAGDRGQKIPQTGGICRGRLTAGGRGCPPSCSVSVPSPPAHQVTATRCGGPLLRRGRLGRDGRRPSTPLVFSGWTARPLRAVGRPRALVGGDSHRTRA
jgi:hypothetical protein